MLFSLLASVGVAGHRRSSQESAAQRSAIEPLTLYLCTIRYDLRIISPVVFIRSAVAFYLALFVLPSCLSPAPARPSCRATRSRRWTSRCTVRPRPLRPWCRRRGLISRILEYEHMYVLHVMNTMILKNTCNLVNNQPAPGQLQPCSCCGRSSSLMTTTLAITLGLETIGSLTMPNRIATCSRNLNTNAHGN